MLQTLATVSHVFLAVAIIALVLLQRGKGADAGAAFGAGASGTVFGSRGTTSFLSRATAILATLFFITSLGLAYLAGQRTEPDSILERAPITAPAESESPSAIPTPAEDGGTPALPADEPPASEQRPPQ
ncbi:MAG: preprotein translocase subunit SecG [Gammaproteobacteria bacterium]|jgi:preprotein translocase subunit SecG